MKFGRCRDCKKFKPLTRHHVSPIKIRLICRACHDKIHDMHHYKPKYNKKYHPGTKRQHKK